MLLKTDSKTQSIEFSSGMPVENKKAAARLGRRLFLSKTLNWLKA
jgi:hypothetical protein